MCKGESKEKAEQELSRSWAMDESMATSKTQKSTPMKKIISLGLFVAFMFSGVSGVYAADKAVTAGVNTVSMPGGWTNYRSLTDEDQAVFKEVKFPLGVQYVPLLVKTQVVAGTNYEFYCIGKAVAPKANWYPVLVTVFRSLDNTVVLKQIIR
jgi:hypothetical protein